MATVTLFNSFENTWPPEAIAGGAITLRTGTNLTYISSLGFTVTLRGTGFTFDDDGLPSGGTIGRMIISKGGVTYAEYTGISADLARSGMLLFGYDRDNGNHQGLGVPSRTFALTNAVCHCSSRGLRCAS